MRSLAVSSGLALQSAAAAPTTSGTEKLVLKDITVGTATVENAYVFKNEGSADTITVQAYNYPLIQPRIEKIDIGKYPNGVHPIMNFDIYEVPEKFTANRTNVEGLAAAAAASSLTNCI